MAHDRDLLSRLCNLPIPNEVRISPNGRQFLYTTRLSWGHYRVQYPVSTIWLATVGESFSSRQITPGMHKDYCLTWHPSGESIAFVSDRAEPGNKWAIYSMSPAEGSQAVSITSPQNEQRIEKLKFSPDGKFIAFISKDEKTAEERERERNREDVQVYGRDCQYARLRIVNVRTARVRALSLSRHVMDFCWSPEGKQIAFVSCRTTQFEEAFLHGSDVSLVDADFKSCRDVCHFPNRVNDLSWASDGKLYFWSGVPSSKKYCGHGVYAVDVSAASAKSGRVAFGLEDDAFGVLQVGGEIIAKLQNRLEDRIVLLSGKVLYRSNQEIEAFDVAFTTHSSDVTLAIATSNVNHPVEVYSATTGNPSLVQLSRHGDAMQNREFGTCRLLSCLSADREVDIDGIYLEPAPSDVDQGGTARREPYPTVVLIHGGPTTRLTNAFNTFYYMWTPYLLSLGYGILMPNYRGSSGRGEKFASYSLGGIGIYDYSDIITLTQHAIDEGYADQNRLVVGGWSQGGLLTNLCCMRNGSHGHGWKFKAAVSGASICDIDTMALTSDMGNSYQPELHNGNVIWKMDRWNTPTRAASALWAFNEVVEQSHQNGTTIVPPMLILHGANDERCPVSQAWGMQRALECYALPFELAIYPRQGHFFKEQNFWIDMALRVGGWCERHIGTAQEVSAATISANDARKHVVGDAFPS